VLDIEDIMRLHAVPPAGLHKYVTGFAEGRPWRKGVILRGGTGEQGPNLARASPDVHGGRRKLPRAAEGPAAATAAGPAGGSIARAQAAPGPNPESDDITEQQVDTRDDYLDRPDGVDHCPEHHAPLRRTAWCCVRMQPPPRAR